MKEKDKEHLSLLEHGSFCNDMSVTTLLEERDYFKVYSILCILGVGTSSSIERIV